MVWCDQLRVDVDLHLIGSDGSAVAGTELRATDRRGGEEPGVRLVVNREHVGAVERERERQALCDTPDREVAFEHVRVAARRYGVKEAPGDAATSDVDVNVISGWFSQSKKSAPRRWPSRQEFPVLTEFVLAEIATLEESRSSPIIASPL